MKRILLLGLLLLSCVGCRQESPEKPISFMVFGEPAELAAYQSLVETFSSQTPEVALQLRHVPGQAEYRQKLAADFSAGAPPDVMLLNYRRFAQYASAEALEPLGTFLDQSELIQASDFFSPTIKSFMLNGQLWCIPQNVSSLVVYYNQDLFDAAGLDYPADDWTREQFLSLARALTQDLDGDGQTDQYGVGLSPKLFRLAPFIWQNGANLVDDLDNPSRLALDSPAALDAFQWFVDLQVKEMVAPDAAAETSQSSESRFLHGQLGMYLNSRRGVPTYRTITTFEWDVAPLPAGDLPAGILHSDGYCMSAQTTDKAGAWAFIEFANSVQGQELIAATGRTVPSLRQVANSPAFLDPEQEPANSAVFVDTIPILRPVPIMDNWGFIEETASREIERAFYGQASVMTAAHSAIQRTCPYFNPPTND